MVGGVRLGCRETGVVTMSSLTVQQVAVTCNAWAAWAAWAGLLPGGPGKVDGAGAQAWARDSQVGLFVFSCTGGRAGGEDGGEGQS